MAAIEIACRGVANAGPGHKPCNKKKPNKILRSQRLEKNARIENTQEAYVLTVVLNVLEGSVLDGWPLQI